MKNFFIAICSLFFLFSCDSGLKFENPNDPNNKANVQQGELNGECYPNNTCNEGLSCDEENNICINESGDAGSSDQQDTSDSTDSGYDSDSTDSGYNPDPSDTGDTSDSGYNHDPADSGDTSSTPSDPTDTGSSQPDPGCTPLCGGKECGSDGCGGSCGTCPENHTCSFTTNTCQCNKSCTGKLCTDDDGCGGTCGCKSNEKCIEDTGVCECVPHCEEGWQCGGDGCGGSCGDGCGDGFCIESTHMCKVCTKVTLSPITDLSKYTTNRYYKTTKNAYTPNTGNTSIEDKYVLSFQTSAITQGQVVDLAEFDSLKSCEDGQAKAALCFIIGEDHDGKGSNSAKVYFTKRGTLTIDEYDKSSDHIKFSLKDVKLGEIKEEIISGTPTNPVAHTERTFPPSGECIIVEDTTLEN